MLGCWGVEGEYLVMDLTVGMFAQFCLIMLSASAASLMLLDWRLSKKTVRADQIETPGITPERIRIPRF